MAEGTDNADTLTGTGASEMLSGLGGDDTLSGAAGNDTLEGGSGTDVAQFGGVLAGYRFEQGDGYLRVIDTNPTDGDDGAELLRNVEHLAFADGTVALDAGGEWRISDVTADTQAGPVVARLPDGGTVVAWSSYEQDGDRSGVFVQRYDAAGSPIGGQQQVNTTAFDDQFDPAVAVLADGGFVVSWTSESGRNYYDVFAQRFDATGNPVGGEILVNGWRGQDQFHSSVAGLADGGFVVCWESYAGYHVLGRVFDADGNPAAGQFRLDQGVDPDSSQGEARVAALPDGGFIAVWSSSLQDGEYLGVFARRFLASGEPAGDEFQVNTTTRFSQEEPGIAVREDGAVAIVWTTGDRDSGNIAMQLYDADGSPHGGEIAVNLTTADYQLVPTVAFVPGSGEAVVAWQSWEQDGDNTGVFARSFRLGDGDAVVGSAEIQVNSHTAGAQLGPSVSGAGADGWVVAWTSGPQDGSFEGAFLQRFEPGVDAGAAGWTPVLPLLRGSAAADRFDLTGDGGDLAAAGGAGDDVYRLDSAGDRVEEQRGGGVDRIETPLGCSLAASPAIEELQLTGLADVQGIGNAAANHLWGNLGRNLLRGAGGDDTLDGGAGADTLSGGKGNDTYLLRDALDVLEERANGGIDTLQSELVSTTLPARVENLVLSGSAALDGYGNTLDNALTGSAVANLLDGGAGADTLAGGRGDDIYRVDQAGDRVVENIGEGTDTVVSLVSFTLAAHLEQLKLAGDVEIDGTGNFLANVIEGNDAANVLDGGTGADVLIGLGGDDTYFVDQAADTVIEDAGGGIDSVIASEAFTLPENVERIRFSDPAGGTRNYSGTGNAGDNLLEGAAGDDALNGLGGNDTLLGHGGDDTLIGGAGADSMAGGTGDDVYEVDDAGDVYVEMAGEGAADEVRSSISHTLLANVELLRLLGTADIDGTGNDAGNRMDGNSGGNLLDGAAGSDGIDAGEGDDTILGGDGDDTMWGGTGVDVMEGGDGNDVFYVDDVLDDTVELASSSTMAASGKPGPRAGGTNIDTVISQVSYTLRANIENLELTGSENLSGNGNELDNLLSGNGGANLLRGLDGVDILDGGGGNDTLDGGNGSDTLGGGAGDDVYVVGAGDRVLESSQQGTDTVQAAVSWTLAKNIEDLQLTGSANLAATGNTAANRLTGNDGRNLLAGGDGNDQLSGGGSADTLTGGLGKDTLSGGVGADVFRFDTAPDGSGNVDTVQDFVRGTDRLQLDADVFTAFSVGVAITDAQILAGAGATAATTAEHRLIYNSTNGALYYDADGLGGAAATRIATITTLPGTLGTGDFVIVG